MQNQMSQQLSKKESMYLQDLKSEEELCVSKYKAYAQQAQDSQLCQLFDKLANEEQKHYDTINQMLQGNLKSGGSMSQSGQQSQSSSQMNQSGGQMNQMGIQSSQLSAQSGQSAGQSQSGSNSSDKTLLHDMLSTEKYVSSSYDKSIFESAQPAVRQALQQIQKDEQGHGEQLFQYMSSHGMYQVQ